MDRRSFLAASALTVTAARVLAADAKAPDAKTPDKNDELVATIQKCLVACYACRELCVATLTSGDTMMAACMRTVEDSIVLCNATAQLAASRSKRLHAVAAACADACDACETECKKHAGHHAQCKACAESCEACVSACRAV